MGVNTTFEKSHPHQLSPGFKAVAQLASLNDFKSRGCEQVFHFRVRVSLIVLRREVILGDEGHGENHETAGAKHVVHRNDAALRFREVFQHIIGENEREIPTFTFTPAGVGVGVVSPRGDGGGVNYASDVKRMVRLDVVRAPRFYQSRFVERAAALSDARCVVHPGDTHIA